MTDNSPKPPPQKPKSARADYRVRMQVLLKYRVAVKQQSGLYALSPLFSGVGVDFSGGGGAFKIGKDIPTGFMLYIEIPFPFQPDPVRVIAEVVRTKPDVLKGKQVLLCTVRYLLMDPDTRDRMVGFIIGEASLQGGNQ